MFGHQDDQNDHRHHDDRPIDNILTDPAVDGVLNSGEDSAPVTLSSTFNPALPASAQDQPGGPSNSSFSNDDHHSVAAPAVAVSNDLLDIKQRALTELSPLVNHLEQSPEEKFRTTMMMIQASDNQDLISIAYEAAQAIPDEKVKAQALLDIVNEINYFTTHHS